MERTLIINEIFYSIQGESSAAGLPCVFVRLTGCGLRCSWCDTEYAFHEGKEKTFEEIAGVIRKYNCNLIEFTGGEPLEQEGAFVLMKELCDEGFTVMVETGGHIDIAPLDPRIKKIMDLKPPDSGMVKRNRYENITHLTKSDEVKFVVASRADYEWIRETISKYNLAERCEILISPAFVEMNYEELAGWILEDHLPVRMQLQLHKFIWHPQTRGV